MCSNHSNICARASNAGSKEGSHTWSECANEGSISLETITETCLTFSPLLHILRDQWR